MLLFKAKIWKVIWNVIKPSSVVRDLVMLFDAELNVPARLAYTTDVHALFTCVVWPY